MGASTLPHICTKVYSKDLEERREIKQKIKKLQKKKEVLMIAIPKEDASLHFYQELASSADDESSREMFKKLAQQEIEHKKILEAMTKELQESIDKLKVEQKKLTHK
ncbi:MAG: hypothetical protein MRK02_02945 [Candidatus Scalindua sp.]|nr:hypothetical protein [Candidatus Scalindua sp.]